MTWELITLVAIVIFGVLLAVFLFKIKGHNEIITRLGRVENEVADLRKEGGDTEWIGHQ